MKKQQRWVYHVGGPAHDGIWWQGTLGDRVVGRKRRPPKVGDYLIDSRGPENVVLCFTQVTGNATDPEIFSAEVCMAGFEAELAPKISWAISDRARKNPFAIS